MMSNAKICPAHLARPAIVYVRQSAQRVPAAEGGIDQIDEHVIVQELVDRAELGTPQLVAVGQQHFEEAALRIRATDHGASMELERVRCTVGRSASITDHDEGARKQRSRQISVRPRSQRCSPQKQRPSAVSFHSLESSRTRPPSWT